MYYVCELVRATNRERFCNRRAKSGAESVWERCSKQSAYKLVRETKSERLAVLNAFGRRLDTQNGNGEGATAACHGTTPCSVHGNPFFGMVLLWHQAQQQRRLDERRGVLLGG